MTAVYSILIAMAVVILLLGIVVVGLLRNHAEVLRRLDRLGVRLDDADRPDHQHDSTLALRSGPTTNGSASVSDLVGVTPEGEPATVSSSIGDDPLLLAFLSTSCTSCTNFWERFEAPASLIGRTRFRVAVVTLGPEEESPTRAIGLRRGTADVLMSSSAWSDYAVPGAPYFVVIDPRAGEVIGEGTAATFPALEEFLLDASNDREWDRARARDRTDADREMMIDHDLREAGISPNDPRLYHSPGEIDD